MTLEEFIKQIKKLNNIEIKHQIKDNRFTGYIQGIINSMEKKKRITNEDLLNIMNARFDMVESRLDKVESRLDKVEIKINNIEREATKHGWDLNHNK